MDPTTLRSLAPQVNVSLAAFPRRHFAEAMYLAENGGPTEPYLGALCVGHVQLCPQNSGVLDESLVDSLLSNYTNTRFRLHANVRVLRHRVVSDFATFWQEPGYWRQLAHISRRLGSIGYSAHAGRRDQSTLDQVLDAARRCEDLFGCRVGVEGHYPTPNDTFLISSWREYAALFDSGVNYALDLSHLNIVAAQSGRIETNLVREMLACERCIEVHVSDNDGVRDQHKLLAGEPWWLDLLAYANSGATIFTESVKNHESTALVSRQ